MTGEYQNTSPGKKCPECGTLMFQTMNISGGTAPVPSGSTATLSISGETKNYCYECPKCGARVLSSRSLTSGLADD